MQDFQPECTINLWIETRGNKPQKLAWSFSLLTRDSVRLVVASGFLGIVSRDQAFWSVLEVALQAAKNLQQEKVILCHNSGVSLEDPRKSRIQAVQSKKEIADSIWQSFRLRRTEEMDPTESAFLRQEIIKNFGSSVRKNS